MAIYYLVYQLTNVVNGKIYIGCHMTKDMDDGYMGSGKRLAYAKKKYGEAAFKKQILSVHESADEMLAEERRLVNEEFLGRADVYNLTLGGRGSWFVCNQPGNWLGFGNLKRPEVHAKTTESFKVSLEAKRKDVAYDVAYRARQSAASKTSPKFAGKVHSEETKLKMSELRKVTSAGERNSQFGTCWVQNGEISKKVTQQELEGHLQDGWKRGRKCPRRNLSFA